ncbi:Acetylornithine deacetylase/Succinyl-diaminopimelate desuccinylase [Sphingomonas laterariae]|uniref:Acetylornithine deacetylase/Succinyl-diaminopimelate desuccinylase n=1 Tax=Edaphosphingomonas laterariae TaxID=861865 RepID=A0A239H4K0_9SPHN|nr:M20/M25/M40 family metallo-hydrolase [Sphingomonas laterariae]SNS75743.1 Acetylornithine deacetylase/Succinyl-diaminopimelate desuccinylase [Sphingomonas laterariae]
MHRVAVAVLAGLSVAIGGTAAAQQSDVGAYRRAHEREILGRLVDLARIPSVAAQPAELDRTADWLVGELRARGFSSRLLAAGANAPKVVFGQLDTPGAKRTVVFYAHYDGQPVTASEWASDPFVPVMRSGPLSAGAGEVDWRQAKVALDPEWRLFGRGVSDDKASIIAFLAAFDALKAAGRKPAVNIKLFWEGEEEAGSPHLAQILKDNAGLLAADLWLIGDGPAHQSRGRTIYFGARGTLGLNATIYGPARPVHDGHYGNWVPNPAARAAGLIAQMRGEDGTILIPGFADRVRPLTRDEKAAIAALPAVEPGLLRELAIGAGEGAEGLTASTMRPALNLRGIRSGRVGAAANNAIPVDAEISIDFRLVPDQTPDEVRRQVEAFVAGKGWTIVRDEPDAAMRAAHPRLIRLDWEAGYPALRTDMGLPVSRAVLAAAGRVDGYPALALPMMGGSVPIYLFQDVLKATVIGLPIVNHDNSQHAPNENLRLQNLWDGIETYAALMTELSW